MKRAFPRMTSLLKVRNNNDNNNNNNKFFRQGVKSDPI